MSLPMLLLPSCCLAPPQAAGFLLLCDQQDGRVLFLPPDESGRLMQIDLSDDAVVGSLFGSGAWQDVMEPLQVGNG